METFRKLFIAAALAGLLSGLFITVVHEFSTSRVIIAAEAFEGAGEEAAPAEDTAAAATTAEATTQEAAGHDHGGEAWAPEDGWERTFFTGLADVLTGIGFSLVLLAGYRIWGGRMTWRTGLFWGLAGFAAVVAAPGLGLPPELPGTEAAALGDRQVWWISTAVLTAGGLGLIFLGQRFWMAVLGVAFLVLPHAIGAPQPAEHIMLAPAHMAHQFVVAATIVGLLFWAVLGATSGYFYNRFFEDARA
jgi:cobalt transporter subunit CbtA